MLFLPEDKSEALSNLYKELGPIRWSEAEVAESVVIASLLSLVETGDVELAPIHQTIGCHTRTSDYCRVLPRILDAPIRTVINMADSQLSYLLREVDPKPWADLIGYAGDVRLLRKVLLNCTPKVGDHLLKRLQIHWQVFLTAKIETQPEPQCEEFLTQSELLENLLLETMNQSPNNKDSLGIAAAESVLRSIDLMESQGRIVVA